MSGCAGINRFGIENESILRKRKKGSAKKVARKRKKGGRNRKSVAVQQESYGYDDQGRIATMTTPAGTRTYAYDSFDQVTGATGETKRGETKRGQVSFN